MFRTISALATLLLSSIIAADSFTLYAYSTDTAGFQVFYSDGLAYISSGTLPSNSSSTTNMTFSLNSTQLSAAPNPTTNENITWPSAKHFYILPSSSSSQVGLVDVDGTPPDGAVTDDFLLLGKSLMYLNNGTLLARFWATRIKPGLWALVWNGSGQKLDKSVPVVLKSTPPLKRDNSASS